MKHVCTLISVADINASRKFYEDLFGLEVFQDYGRNIEMCIRDRSKGCVSAFIP